MNNWDGWKRWLFGGLVALGLGALGTGAASFSLFQFNFSIQNPFASPAPNTATTTNASAPAPTFPGPIQPDQRVRPSPSYAPTYAPSFDCAVDKGWSEQEVCHDATLAQYDRAIHDLYWQRRREASPEESLRIKQDEIAFLHQRTACATVQSGHDCIAALMQQRIRELGGSLE